MCYFKFSSCLCLIQPIRVVFKWVSVFNGWWNLYLNLGLRALKQFLVVKSVSKKCFRSIDTKFSAWISFFKALNSPFLSCHLPLFSPPSPLFSPKHLSFPFIPSFPSMTTSILVSEQVHSWPKIKPPHVSLPCHATKFQNTKTFPALVSVLVFQHD